jgi:RNA-binding protein
VLTGKQRRFLRALGHHLDPIVQVGKQGFSAGLVSALDVALLEHELIKVRLGEPAGPARQGVAEGLAEAAAADLVGVLGRTVLLYRPHPDEPQIRLP